MNKRQKKKTEKRILSLINKELHNYYEYKKVVKEIKNDEHQKIITTNLINGESLRLSLSDLFSFLNNIKENKHLWLNQYQYCLRLNLIVSGIKFYLKELEENVSEYKIVTTNIKNNKEITSLNIDFYNDNLKHNCIRL